MTYSTVIMIRIMIKVLHLLIYGIYYREIENRSTGTHIQTWLQVQAAGNVWLDCVFLWWVVNPTAQIKPRHVFLAAGLHILNSGLALIIFSVNHMLNGCEPFGCTRLLLGDHSIQPLYSMVQWNAWCQICLNTAEDGISETMSQRDRWFVASNEQSPFWTNRLWGLL